MKNKTILNKIIIIVGIIILIALSAYIYMDYKDREMAKEISNMPSPSESINKQNNILSKEIIDSHNNQNDCWLIIENKVLDVTAFINKHPGGKEAIINNCGKDATELFNSTSNHAKQSVKALIERFTIGYTK